MAAEGSSTAKYTTYAKVIAELVGNVPSSLTEGVVNTIITECSRMVDARLVDYHDFPDIAASPGPVTPPIIEMITRYYAVWECYGRIAASNRTTVNSQAQWFLQRADAEIDSLVSERSQVPREGVTSETLTFGTGAAGALATDEAPLAKKNVVPETVEIVTPSTDTEYGVDYEVYYDEGHRTWVYHGISSLGQAATVVSYEFSYLRTRETERMGIRTGVLERA